MTIIDRQTGETVLCEGTNNVIKTVYNPISGVYQQISDEICYLTERYKDDVHRYDRAVGSRALPSKIKTEFLSKWERKLPAVIKFVNDWHPNIKIIM